MPNSGKTTLFNGLTGAKEKTGNWHGVTVNSVRNTYKYDKTKTVVDLAGTYSLSAVTLEEKNAINEVLNTNGLIIFLVEAITLPLVENTLKTLLGLNKKIILAVNMVSELYKSGGKIDIEGLENELPCKVVLGDFKNKSDLKKLVEIVKNYSNFDKKPLKTDINLSKFIKVPTKKTPFFDRILTYGLLSPIILLFILLGVFYLTFGKYGIGKICTDFLNGKVFENFSNFVKKSRFFLEISPFLQGLLLEGIIGGLGGVFAFLPQILILTIFLNLLEQSGYMSRVAYILNGILSKLGLNGRAIFTLLSGLGCTAVSAVTANGLENTSVKKKVILTTGMISCSAKIPFITFLANLPIIKNPFLFVIGIYAFGVVLAVLQTVISNKIIKGEKVPLIIELPPLRVPSVKTLLETTLKTLKQVSIKILTVIFLISNGVYLLKNICVPTGSGKSIIYYLGESFKWLFYPIGIYDYKITVSLITGIFAKEGVLSSVITLLGGNVNLPVYSVIALAVFYYVYTPCLTAIFAVKAETNGKFALKFALFQLLEGLIISYTVYALLTRFFITLTVLVGCFLCVFIVKRCLKSKKSV